MSSPRLNNLIVVGCIMTYFSVILFGLDGGLISTEQYGKVCIVSISVIYMSLYHAPQKIEPIRVQECRWECHPTFPLRTLLLVRFRKYYFFNHGITSYKNIWRFIFILKNELSHMCFPSLLGSCLDHVYWFHSGVWRNVREDVASSRNL